MTREVAPCAPRHNRHPAIPTTVILRSPLPSPCALVAGSMGLSFAEPKLWILRLRCGFCDCAQNDERGALRCPSACSFAPRFLPTLGRPHAVALRFVRCDQLTVGLPPTRVRPCRAHTKKPPSPCEQRGFWDVSPSMFRGPGSEDFTEKPGSVPYYPVLANRNTPAIGHCQTKADNSAQERGARPGALGVLYHATRGQGQLLKCKYQPLAHRGRSFFELLHGWIMSRVFQALGGRP